MKVLFSLNLKTIESVNNMPEQIENRIVVGSEWQPMYKPVCRCGECGCDIYEGNYFYDFDGDIVCEDCEREYVIEHFRRCIN